MTKDEKIEYLRGEFEYDATCPCCGQIEKCEDECTFSEDAPGDFAEMMYAREVLEKTK